MRQKDCDGRWIKKNGVSRFGDKNHMAVDEGTKLIVNWDVTPANVHGSQVFEVLLGVCSTGDRRILGRQCLSFTGEPCDSGWVGIVSPYQSQGQEGDTVK